MPTSTAPATSEVAWGMAGNWNMVRLMPSCLIETPVLSQRDTIIEYTKTYGRSAASVPFDIDFLKKLLFTQPRGSAAAGDVFQFIREEAASDCLRDNGRPEGTVSEDP